MKESEKKAKYPDLARELKKKNKLWNMKVMIIPIVIVFIGNPFEMKLLNLRINFFIYCWLFVLILVVFLLYIYIYICLPFPKKGDLGLAKNYRGITLTSIAAKIYNALLWNRIEPKIDNILRKNQNGFQRNRSTTSQILTIRRILEGVRAKNLQATLIFVDFTKAFDSIHTGKMEQILLAYGIPKETVAAIKILYRNTKVKVRSPDGDTEYFDIVAGVQQGDTLAPYLFIICLDYVLRTSIDKIRENGFEPTKKRSRRYPAKTITDSDYADDIAILANTPDQAETLLRSLERAAADIGLDVNAHQMEYMCYNQTGDISTLDRSPS